MRDDGYRISGMCPEQVALPQSVSDAQEMIRAAQGKAVLPWGGGTCQHVGYAPERADIVLSTKGLTQITEYEPADMTVTVQAGVTLSQLQETLAAQGQWLPLSVAHPEAQTIGGIVAARALGLTRLAHGSVRDHLLGVTVINHAGELVKGGGKVVKNVAGYDLPKLYCGSWGTLGLICEASFKVAPVPQATATVVLPLPAELNSEETLDTLAASDLVPSLLFLLSSQAAQSVLETGDDAQYLIVGFDDAAEAVAWQVETLGAPDVLSPESALEVRTRLRDFAHRDVPMACTFHILPSQVGAYSRMMEWTARRHGLTASVVSDAGVGIVHAQFTPQDDDARWETFYADFRDKADRVGGSCVVERLPEALRALDIPRWSPVLADFALMARLKETLDPQRMWNPGRFINHL